MRKKIFVITGILLLILVVKLIASALQLSPFLVQLMFNKEISLKKSSDRVNILLLGIGGGNHDGTYLTDTIIFASLDQENNKVTLVSIPRDLWVPDLPNPDKKINTAYSDAEYMKKGGGVIVASAAVSKIVGQPIDYTARIDFNGFVKAIDLLEGIDLNVENALDDYIYPVEGKEADSCGKSEEDMQAFISTASSSAEQNLADFFPCRYQHIHFDKGLNHMDGENALKFVRSRHALGEEGTDFARSRRQEDVMQAIKNKVFSLNILLNPSKIVDFYNVLKGSIDTNIKQDEFDDFIRLALKMKQAQIESAILDFGDEETQGSGLLIHPTDLNNYNNEWVLIPKIGNNNFSEIQKYVSCEINSGNCSILGIPVTPTNEPNQL